MANKSAERKIYNVLNSGSVPDGYYGSAPWVSPRGRVKYEYLGQCPQQQAPQEEGGS
jgi:hypothetical protein